ncbi:MAG: dockerin type I domain-containing protein [candidate division KSB1 bacterium]|nr:dockerin type I domain-containing protein [candidate division KSB1 bacterium]
MTGRIWFEKYVLILLMNLMLIKGVAGQNGDQAVLGQIYPDATFICKNANERCGYSMAGAGDVNGDGFSDFMVAAYHNYLHGWNSGGVYLITGALNQRWGMNVDIEAAATAVFRGSQDYDMVGYCVAGKGDFNGDGLSDMIIGAPGTWDRMPESPGWAYLVFGKKEMDWGKDYQLEASADVKIVGEKPLDQFGYAVSFVGDINHDGYDDIICGAPYRNQYQKWDGKAYLILGAAQGWDGNHLVAKKAVASFVFPAEQALTGYSVAGVGDVNQDGTPDFVIGVPGANVACLILGRPAVDWGLDFDLRNADSKFWGEVDGDYAGSWISAANDVNHDGYPDFMISAIQAYFNGGKIYVVLGRKRWTESDISLKTADASFRGEDVETHTGFCTSGLKDYDGDGYDDLLIGARYLNSIDIPHAGKVYVIKGRPGGWQHDADLENSDYYFWGPDSITCAGWQVADVGDVNGDHGHDFIASGPFNSTGAHWGGKIFFFYGKNIAYHISGTIVYYSHFQPISDAKLTVTGNVADSTLSDRMGRYSLWLKPNGNYRIAATKAGPIGNQDYAISAYDAARVASHAIGIDTLSNWSRKAADVDQNGVIQMFDAAQIARYAVDLPALESSHVGEFRFDPESRWYSNLGQSFLQENFIGLLLGDVDGNWQTHTTIAAKNTGNSILPSSIVTLFNSRPSIPLTINDFANARSVDIQFEFDPTQLQFLELHRTEVTKNFSLVLNANVPGLIKIALFSATPVHFQGEIARLQFKLVNLNNTNLARLKMTVIRVNDVRFPPEETLIFMVDKNGLNIATEATLISQPNPFNPSTTLIFKNNMAGKGKLMIYDVLGKAVRCFDLGFLLPGVHQVFWDGADDSGNELSSGVYFARFQCDAKESIIKLIKLK